MMAIFHQRSAMAGTSTIGSPPCSSPPLHGSGRPQRRDDVLAEDVDEAFLLLADVVDPDPVEAEFGELDELVAQAGRIATR